MNKLSPISKYFTIVIVIIVGVWLFFAYYEYKTNKEIERIKTEEAEERIDESITEERNRERFEMALDGAPLSLMDINPDNLVWQYLIFDHLCGNLEEYKGYYHMRYNPFEEDRLTHSMVCVYIIFDKHTKEAVEYRQYHKHSEKDEFIVLKDKITGVFYLTTTEQYSIR